jgi:26S proteasome regulatory subunit N2
MHDREALYEADSLPSDARDLAALVVSKVYYHLGEYEEALSFALSAGQAFNAQTRSPNAEEYVETVVCKCTSTHAFRYLLRVVAQTMAARR